MICIESQCLVVALTSASVAFSVLTNRCVNGCVGVGWLTMTSEASLTLLAVVVAAVMFDMYRLGPAASHSYSTLYDHYKAVRRILYHGRRVTKHEDRCFVKARAQQKQNLLNIINDARKTKYGKENGFDQIRTMVEFRRQVPISTYERYLPYVNRVLQGERDVFFAGVPVFIGTTSGTTGKYKCYPKSSKYFKLAVDYLLYKSFYVLYSAFPSVALKKVLTIQTFHTPTKLDSGYMQGPISAAITAHRSYFVVPQEGYFLTTAEASTYVTLLFGLKEPDVGIFTSLFSSSGLVFFNKMEANWKELCDDIELGRIRSGFGIPLDKLESLRSQFVPDPMRAEELRREFRKGFCGIAQRIWRGCKVTMMIATGVFKSAADILRATYLNGIVNFSRFHGGTEAGYGFVDTTSFPADPVYYLMATEYFYELLPIDDGCATEETIMPYEAEVGKQYELVVTTNEGLYRYRTTDVITVVGFHFETVKYKFAQRVGDVLYLNNEKTPVHVVESALYETLRHVASAESIADFCCTESVHVDRVKGESCGELAYWVFVEMTSGYILPPHFADEMERRLTEALDSYRRHRHHGTADMVKVVQLKPGAFGDLRARILATKPTTSVDQYKAPRLIRQDEFIQIFLERVM